MKEYVIFGTGTLSDLVTYVIEDCLGDRVSAYVVDDEYMISNSHNGREVVPLSKLVEKYSPNRYGAVVGFAGGKMMDPRERVSNILCDLGYSMENIIHPSAVISTKSIGYGNVIFENCVLAHNVKFGSGNIMFPLSVINHDSVVGNFNHISPCVSIPGIVTVGNHCFLGNNSTYKNRIHVLDYTFVGAGSYIIKDTEKYAVYTPVRTVKLDKNSLDIII